eukprot:CAMPEP_0114320632 /NCGR_PEP_ID=MMETSP0059-20121206/26063_1 /TAXON_ID=36894 /ORGANISM="Pyramimonas parkeae, Strain CCMP726" /LENGTH=53 /DNA_ID=CAMNT_0001448089 /DNA_START=188 /DNA_END=349 /DNA_ORIENTATION=+
MPENELAEAAKMDEGGLAGLLGEGSEGPVTSSGLAYNNPEQVCVLDMFKRRGC